MGRTAPITGAQIYDAVYVKLRTIELPDVLADRIAKAAYQEFIRAESERLKRPRRKRT